MKSRFEVPNGGKGESDAIRTDIAQTRSKMDHTIDEISKRLTPRHLVDEFLEIFRSHQPDKHAVKEKASAAARKAGDTASHVGHALADMVRDHPIPTLLIGAGVAWALYEGKKDESDYYDHETEYENEEDMNYETSIEQGSPAIAGQTQQKSQLKTSKEKVQEKLADTGERMRSKAGEIRERAMERSRRLRARAGEVKHRVGEGTRRAYNAGRDRFVETSEAHPLSTGLGFLAIGLLAGLALPSTQKEDEWIGRTSDKLKHHAKEQGQEFVERGRQVVSAAASAAKHEAEHQGLSPEGIKQKAKEVASQAQSAAEQSAREQGLPSRKEQGFGTQGEPGMPGPGKQV